MSCESNSNKLASLAGQLHSGISQLASKGAFYSGVAVGAAGTGLSLLVIARLRRPKPLAGQPVLIKVGPEGKQVAQTTAGRSQPTPPKAPRPGSRYNPLVLEMAAPAAPGSRARPRKLAMGGTGAHRRPKKLDMAGGRPLPVLPAKPLETRLQKAATQVLTGRGQRFTAENSYRVVQPDGTDTGLAVTPAIGEDDQGQLTEDTSAWCVTHTPTGALMSGPYSAVATAHRLATQLSPLGWRLTPVPEADVARARQIIDEYQQSLVEK